MALLKGFSTLPDFWAALKLWGKKVQLDPGSGSPTSPLKVIEVVRPADPRHICQITVPQGTIIIWKETPVKVVE